MYNLIESILNIPAQYANSTVTYIAGVILLLFVVVMIDLIYKLFRVLLKGTERR